MFLLYGGGLVFATVFMIVATFRRARLSTLVTFVLLSVFSLVAQAGCWSAAAGIGRATNGGGSGAQDWDWYHAVSSGFVISAVWALILFISRTPRRDSLDPPTQPPKPDTFDY